MVASAGGHLEQAVHLLPRLRYRDVVFATYETDQASSLLRGETIVAVHHPTTKNLKNAVRNYRLARHTLDDLEIDRAMSTGAGVAVPFFIEARRLGLPCHYIESATRVTGPSLSGRMMNAIPDVHRYRQMGDWGGRRWQPGPCVFDGYQLARSTPAQLQRIIVSLGTHDFAFRALPRRVSALLRPAAASDVVWQLGSTPATTELSGRCASYLSAEEFRHEVAASDVVIGHAGVGLVLTALAAGKVPVIVPRRRSRGEHTDDHQVQLAAELERRGLAVVAEVGELSREHIERAAELVVTYDEPPPFALID